MTRQLMTVRDARLFPIQVTPDLEGMRRFTTADQAFDYQVDQGGWVYVLDSTIQAFWFHENISAYRIMLFTPAFYLAGRLFADPARSPNSVG